MKTGTIKQSVTIAAEPHEIYEALLDAKKHTDFTGAEATGSAKVGGSFSAYDGYITGKHKKLVTDKTVPLRLEFANNTVSLEAGAGEEAQATEAIEILLNGEPISIAFNPVFLADGLQAVGTSFVQISFTGSNKPAILSGKSDRDGKVIENYRYLLMPMRYAS